MRILEAGGLGAVLLAALVSRREDLGKSEVNNFAFSVCSQYGIYSCILLTFL